MLWGGSDVIITEIKHRVNVKSRTRLSYWTELNWINVMNLSHPQSPPTPDQSVGKSLPRKLVLPRWQNLEDHCRLESLLALVHAQDLLRPGTVLMLIPSLKCPKGTRSLSVNAWNQEGSVCGGVCLRLWLLESDLCPPRIHPDVFPCCLSVCGWVFMAFLLLR